MTIRQGMGAISMKLVSSRSGKWDITQYIIMWNTYLIHYFWQHNSLHLSYWINLNLSTTKENDQNIGLNL